jgi:hypothetical protein
VAASASSTSDPGLRTRDSDGDGVDRAIAEALGLLAEEGRDAA